MLQNQLIGTTTSYFPDVTNPDNPAPGNMQQRGQGHAALL